MTPSLSAASQALAWTLLHFLWQGALLGALAWAGLTALARRSASARYLWASAVLGLMALAPLLTFLLLLPGGAPAAEAGLLPSPAEALPLWARMQLQLQPWLPALTVGWLAGASLFGLRLAGGLVMIQRLKEVGTTPVPSQWHLVLSRLSRELKLSRTVRLLGSAKVDVPTVVGWLRPVILLPASAFTQLSPAQLEAILAHELAHVRRHDFAVNLLQACVEALLFYHPAIWWLSARIREERELACDDVAVALCGDALAYAQALAVLDDLRSPLPTLALASHGGSLMKRITRLIQPQLLPTPTLRTALLSALTATALSAAGLALQEAKKEEKKRSVMVQKLEDGRAVSIRTEGEVTVKPEEKEPLTLAPGARFRLSEKKDGKVRRLDVTPGKKVYTVDGAEKPYDAETERWLKDALRASEKARAQATEPHALDAARMAEDAKRMGEDQKRMKEDLKRMQIELHHSAEEAAREARRVQVEVIQEGDQQKIITKKDGQVVEERVIGVPKVEVLEEGGLKKIIVKQDGKVVTETFVPDVKVEGGDGMKKIVIRRGDQVEERVIHMPRVRSAKGPDGKAVIVETEGSGEGFWTEDEFGDRPFVWHMDHPQVRTKALRRGETDEVKALRKQVEDLKRQVEELKRQGGAKPAAKPAPVAKPA